MLFEKFGSVMLGVALFGPFALTSVGKASGAVEIRFLVYDGYVTDALLAPFKEQIKKEMNVDLSWKISSIQNEEQIFNETRRNAVDVFSGGNELPDDERFLFVKNNLVSKINIKNIPNYEKLYKYNQKMPHLLKEGSYYGIPIAAGVFGLIYDTEAVNPPPKHVKDILKPEFQSKFVLTTYKNQTSYLVALASGYKGKDVANFDKLSKDPKFQENLKTLVTGAKCFDEVVDSADSLIKAKATMALGYGFSFGGLKDAGKKWAFADTSEGNVAWVDNFMATSAAAKDPLKLKVIEKFFDYALGESYQKEMSVKTLASWPVNAGVISKFTAEEKQKWPHLLSTDLLEKKSVLLMPLNRRERNGFAFAHDKALGSDVTPKLCKTVLK
jgi:spermidine/putrescine-binding protein